MAQKIVTVYTDDLTGKEAEDVQTHSFSLDQVNYEIDLTSDSYDRLFEALAPFINQGRKIGRAKTGNRLRKTTTPTGPTAEEVRAWARENNYDVNDRGRVPSNIREAYDRAH
ncbi:histone-like nucleoid-structuring protein Lsr2 [Streptomyces chartreusis]|uniref:histone-like nucleoid-structuring protein Lsr2 n=1 Tax=Streptomyces chartreusis TaxID=1969 RepID=UPI0037FF51EA